MVVVRIKPTLTVSATPLSLKTVPVFSEQTTAIHTLAKTETTE